MKRYLGMIFAILIASGACKKPLATEPDVLRTLLKLDEISPSTLAADGLSEAKVTATITSKEAVATSKLDVQFETTGGKLLGGEALTSCQTSGAVSCIKVAADRGSLKAEATLKSSTTGGSVTVTAILLSAGVRDSKTVTFVSGSGVLSFAGTPSTAEADGVTAVQVVVHADSRLAAGQKVEIETSRGGFYPAGTGSKISVPVGLDGIAMAELISLEEPVSTALTASVIGSTLAPARHSIKFDLALPARIVLTGDASVTAGASVDLTAEFFRNPGEGSVTAGITPLWSADKVNANGIPITEDVGNLTNISPIQAKSGSPTSRIATAKFEASGLVAGDRVKVTVMAKDGGIAGEHFLTVK